MRENIFLPIIKSLNDFGRYQKAFSVFFLLFNDTREAQNVWIDMQNDC